jgi:hypothetical protein
MEGAKGMGSNVNGTKLRAVLDDFAGSTEDLLRPFRAWPVRAGYPGLRSFLAPLARPPTNPR